MSATELKQYALKYPTGTTAQRPSNPVAGAYRFNTTEGAREYYDGTKWVVDVALGSLSNPAVSGQVLNDQGYSSGYYYIQPSGQSVKYCYVDNEHFGGGWVLVQTVGSNNDYHWNQTGDFNLYSGVDGSGNPVSYVPFSGTGYSSSTGRRYSDSFTKALGSAGDGVFRLEIARNGAETTNDNTLVNGNDYKVAQFVRYDNGINNYNSSNNGGDSDRTTKAIDIAHYYPYETNWETGGDGHYINAGSDYKVFDGHSDPSSINTSLYSSVRFLWGYNGGTGAGNTVGDGIYGGNTYSFNAGSNNPGYMWVK